jgi:hypothetical protein
VPHRLDFEHLVPVETEVVDGVTRSSCRGRCCAIATALR